MDDQVPNSYHMYIGMHWRYVLIIIDTKLVYNS